ncbi:chromosome segregation protein Csm1/Pcs1-domain-containing protein [Xylaria intraflava]|nr:chromosome segregation protein Csm1/Pcs1-domain-containing protein [Xylaria intraflava]
MPAAKKSVAAATRRGNKSTRAAQATTTQDVLSEKTVNIPEEQPPAQKRGKKRAATEVINTPEDQAVEDKPKGRKGRSKVNKAQKTTEPEEEDELSETQENIAPEPAKKRRKAKTNAQDVEIEIPETQQPEVEIPETQQVDAIDITADEEETEDQIEEQPTYLQRMLSVQRHQSRRLPGAGQKPMLASDSELNEPNLRRRIGELTRQNQALETKYRDLREIGVQEAERNFDRLKKQGEERANTDKQLIETLKAQLASETEAAKSAEGLQKQLEDSQRMVEELREKLEGAQSALAESKTEIKALSTKLTAARSLEPANLKVPGSAMKNNYANNRQVASAAEAVTQLAHKKEDLYGDLTGLLVCGVKHEKDEEVFDCVQTGRNGTLHFKLVIGGQADKIDDAQFMYMPQLDPARDKALIDILPDYLVEEITFPRLHAAKFYSRVVKALTERPE